MPLWSRRSSTIASLQRVYDEAYQNSLQSILKESSYEYKDSLKSWKLTLQTISAGLATLDGSPLRGAQEKSLMSSILDIERQCHDRISFLQTKLYKPDQVTNPYRNGSATNLAHSSGSLEAKPAPKNGDSSISPAVAPKTHSDTRLRRPVAQSTSQKSASESDVHPRKSAVDNGSSESTTEALDDLQINPRPVRSGNQSSSSIAPRAMVKTLRSGGSRSSGRPAVAASSKAATLAWTNPAVNAKSNVPAPPAPRERSSQILRNAQQTVQTRNAVSRGDGNIRRSPKLGQLDQLAGSQQQQFSGFEGSFVKDEFDFVVPGGSPTIPQEPISRTSSPQVSAARPAASNGPRRPANRYVVTKSKPVGKQASPEAKKEPEQQLDEWDIMAREKIKDLRGVDSHAAEQILLEVVLKGDLVHWTDIAGLEKAKASLKETVVYPFLRPDLFSGLREPALGMLLFGPPGTGKTMLARAVATESKSTFFSISASSLTSKYMGESEKLVRALFQMAKALAPSIIFVDEIDSILTQRADSGEHEASRRIKNEFLVQWSDLQAAAVGKNPSENVRRVLVLGATNLPWAIDEAARRRFVRRQYIPLPEKETRKVHLSKLLSHQKHGLTEVEIDRLVDETDGYSGSDLTALAKDAAMGPLRCLGEDLLTTDPEHIRPINLTDFEDSMKTIRASVSPEGLRSFEQWASLYGSSGA